MILDELKYYANEDTQNTILEKENQSLKEIIKSLNEVVNNKSQQLDDIHKEEYQRFLQWRQVPEDDVCPTCYGSGVSLYSSTSTWRGGIGGQAMTIDICDSCWGSGRKSRHWMDLRTLK